MHARKGFTYRYYTGNALFPFGYGLSYTKFDYSKLKINTSKLNTSGELNVSFKIRNTGKHDDDEVPQLYIKDFESDKCLAIK